MKTLLFALFLSLAFLSAQGQSLTINNFTTNYPNVIFGSDTNGNLLIDYTLAPLQTIGQGGVSVTTSGPTNIIALSTLTTNGGVVSYAGPDGTMWQTNVGTGLPLNSQDTNGNKTFNTNVTINGTLTSTSLTAQATAATSAVVTNGSNNLTFQGEFVSPTSSTLGSGMGLTRTLPPWRGVDMYETAGEPTTEAQVMSTATNLIASGLYSAGYDTILVEDGWWLGRNSSTLQLISNTNFYPDGISNVIGYLHGLGFKVNLYIDDKATNATAGNPVVPTFGGAGQGGTDEYISDTMYSNDVTGFKGWGIDAFTFDTRNTIGDSVNRGFREGWSKWFKQIYPNCQLEFLNSALTNIDNVIATPQNFNGYTVGGLSIATVAPRVPAWLVNDSDVVFAATDWGISNAFQSIYYDHFLVANAIGKYLNTTKHPDLQGFTYQGTPSNFKEELTLWAMAHSSLKMGGGGSPFAYSTIGQCFTNPAILKIQRDSAYNWPVNIFNNGSNVVAWAETLSDGTIAVAVINLDNINSQTVTIPINTVTNFTSVTNGYSYSMSPAYVPYVLQDAWNNYSLFPDETTWNSPNGLLVTNSITVTMATNGCDLFMLTPAPAQPLSLEILNDPTLVFHASFSQGSLSDGSIFKNNVVSTTGTPAATNGIMGGGIYLNGSSSFTYAQETELAVITNSAWTIYCAFSSTNATGSQPLFSLIANGWQSFNLQLQSSNQVQFDNYQPGGIGTLTGTALYNVNDSAWHLMVVTRNNYTNYNLYLDGSLLATSSSLANQPIFTNNFQLSVGNSGSGLAGPGVSVDEPSIFARTFTSNEVASLWNLYHGSSLVPSSLIIGNTTGTPAATGIVGEQLSTSIIPPSAITVQNGVTTNFFVTLTAGVWRISGLVTFAESTASVSARAAVLSLTANGMTGSGTTPYIVYNDAATSSLSDTNSLVIPTRVFVCTTATTNAYVNILNNYSAGSVTAYGYLSAIRNN